jgi:sulfhydrogenase subunit alpha
VLSAIRAIESIIDFKPSETESLFRELMHLGMVIESHATHICALALPDFLNTPDLHDFATNHQEEFAIWTKLRNLGSAIQTTVGGRPFHPVNLHVGGLSQYPGKADLQALLEKLEQNKELAVHLCNVLLDLKPPVDRTAAPTFLALIPDNEAYGYFGTVVKSSDGWEKPVTEYKNYLNEKVVSYSHAKRSLVDGKPIMVGSLARLHFFANKLSSSAKSIYSRSPLAAGNNNTILNNLAQGIELVEAIDRCMVIIGKLTAMEPSVMKTHEKPAISAGKGVGAVECPRGTLYHCYEIDAEGKVTGADMITPSAQNTARIEQDISTVVEDHLERKSELMQSHLETLVRAYDPCNTCATHMVQVRYLE